MSATPEREQAEALRSPEQWQWIRDRYKPDGLRRLARANRHYADEHGEYLPDVAALAYAEWERAESLAAAVSRLEAERDKLFEERSALLERTAREYDELVTAEVAVSRLVERAEKAEREMAFVATVLDTHGAPLGIPESEYNAGPYNLAGRVDAFARAAVERERELTRALAAIAENAESWHGPEGLGSGHAKALAVVGAWAREALAGGVSAAGRPPEQDLGGGTAAVAEALRSVLEEIATARFASVTGTVDYEKAVAYLQQRARDALTTETAEQSNQEGHPAAPEVLPEETP